MKSKNVFCGLSMAVVLHFGTLAGSAQTNIYLYSGSLTNITLPPGTYIITAYGAPGGFPSHTFAGLGGWGGSGAEMSAEFNFSTSTTLTLLVGGGGYPYSPPNGSGYSGGGGGGSFVVQGGTPLVIAGGGGGGGGLNGGENDNDVNGNVSNNGGSAIDGPDGSYPYGGGGTDGGGGGSSKFSGGALCEGSGGGGGGFLGNGGAATNGNNIIAVNGGGGSSFKNGGNGGNGGNGFYADGGNGGYGGGGGSIIDSSAITILAEVSGSTLSSSPDDPKNGEIIITAVPTPLFITANAAFGFTNGVFGFDLSGPSGASVVIQASTDLQTWIPLQTNLLGSGPLYFSDSQSTTNTQRFYRAQLSP